MVASAAWCRADRTRRPVVQAGHRVELWVEAIETPAVKAASAFGFCGGAVDPGLTTIPGQRRASITAPAPGSSAGPG